MAIAFCDLSDARDQRKITRTIAKRNNEISEAIISHYINLGLLPQISPIQLIDILWASFLGIFQVEESKLRTSKKDHLFETLECCFLLISKGLCDKGFGKVGKGDKKLRS